MGISSSSPGRRKHSLLPSNTLAATLLLVGHVSGGEGLGHALFGLLFAVTLAEKRTSLYRYGDGAHRCRLGALLMTAQLCSLCPFRPHRGFLVAFLLIHFQERFRGDHLNTALNFPALPSWPLACQLPASQPREEAE